MALSSDAVPSAVPGATPGAVSGAVTGAVVVTAPGGAFATPADASDPSEADAELAGVVAVLGEGASTPSAVSSAIAELSSANGAVSSASEGSTWCSTRRLAMGAAIAAQLRVATGAAVAVGAAVDVSTAGAEAFCR